MIGILDELRLSWNYNICKLNRWKCYKKERLLYKMPYDYCPEPCNFLGSPRMPLSFGSTICFISITTHLNIEKVR